MSLSAASLLTNSSFSSVFWGRTALQGVEKAEMTHIQEKPRAVSQGFAKVAAQPWPDPSPGKKGSEAARPRCLRASPKGEWAGKETTFAKLCAVSLLGLTMYALHTILNLAEKQSSTSSKTKTLHRHVSGIKAT